MSVDPLLHVEHFEQQAEVKRERLLYQAINGNLPAREVGVRELHLLLGVRCHSLGHCLGLSELCTSMAGLDP